MYPSASQKHTQSSLSFMLGSILFYVILPDSSNNYSHMKIIMLPLYSDLHLLPSESNRRHHFSLLPHVGNLIPALRGIVETEMTKRK